MSENGEIDGGGLEDAHPMEPDHEACYRAISTRDARFDGRIFTAVRTTRIYCRPICSARTPKRENVTFFTTASAAQEAGYRPCYGREREPRKAGPALLRWSRGPRLGGRGERMRPSIFGPWMLGQADQTRISL
jgi:hypothetical protein